MKKRFTVFFCLAAVSVLSVPVLSGCAGNDMKFILSEEGGKHYVVRCPALSSLAGEYEIPAYYGEGESYAPVTEIADEGFAGSSFTKIIIPSTVTKIGTAAFSFCPALRSVEFSDGINLATLSHGMFGESTELKEVRLPDSVKTIERFAFKGCEKLSEVGLSKVETIGARAFEGCKALKEVELPATLTSIGELAFYRAGLTSVEIPSSVRDTEVEGKAVYGLGYGAFNNCLSLTTVKICDGIGVVTAGSFGYCPELREIYIPLSVTEIQGALYDADEKFSYGHAFYGDEKLTDVYYGGSEEQWKDIKIDYKSVYENNASMDNDAIKNAKKHYEFTKNC